MNDLLKEKQSMFYEATCLRCQGQMITVETAANGQIKTCFCKECGLIENSFTKPMIEELLEKAVKVGENENKT